MKGAASPPEEMFEQEKMRMGMGMVCGGQWPEFFSVSRCRRFSDICCSYH